MHHRTQRFHSAPALQPARIMHPPPSHTHSRALTHIPLYSRYTRTESWRNIIDDVTQYHVHNTFTRALDNILTEHRGVCEWWEYTTYLVQNPWTYALRYYTRTAAAHVTGPEIDNNNNNNNVRGPICRLKDVSFGRWDVAEHNIAAGVSRSPVENKKNLPYPKPQRYIINNAS